MNEEAPQKRTILVADDDPIVIQLLTHMLTEAGYEADAVSDGQQCLERVAQAQPDLILMDISMPEMDGVTACRRLKEMPGLEHIPVVFVTSNADDETLEGAFAAGGSDYVRKPVNRVELLVRVGSVLAQQEALEKLAEKERLKAALETAGGVCHSLNQPLQYVLGAVQILMMDLDPDDQMYKQLDKVRVKLEQIGDITSKMARITQYQTRAHAGGQIILDIDKSIQ